MNFMIDFRDTAFLETSKTAAHANRLNWRCEMLLTRNSQVIEGNRILDLASHDGRFSYACLKLGAEKVTGIEGRPELVKNATANLEEAGCDTSRFEFVCGDIFQSITRFLQEVLTPFCVWASSTTPSNKRS